MLEAGDMKLDNLLPNASTLPSGTHQSLSLVKPGRKPSLLVVGDPHTTNSIQFELKDTALIVKTAKYIKDIKKIVDGSEVAVILTLPLLKGKVNSIATNLQRDKKLKSTPVFAVVPNWLEPEKERRMYKYGVRMIFEWPSERKHFSEMLVGLIGANSIDVRADDVDLAMEKAIYNRIRARFGRMRPRISIRVKNSIVTLHGEVRSMWRKRELLRTVKRTPGLRTISQFSLNVRSDTYNQRKIKKEGQKIIKSMPRVSEKTLSLDVKGPEISLSGTCESYSAADQLCQELEKIEGVERVFKRVKISPRQFMKDENLAKRAQRVVKNMKLTSGSQVVVKVCLGKAKLEGFVRDRIHSRYLQKAIESLRGIHGVDNKLTIQPG